METRLRKLNTSQLTEICRKMNCSRGSKKNMIGNLLRPLGKKYKMEKITDPRVKGEIMSFLTDEEASNFLVDRQNKVNLQWDMDKRARKHMTKIRKWNNLFNGKGVQPIPGEGKVPGPDNFKDIGEVFDLNRRGFLTYPHNFLEKLGKHLYRQLELAIINGNTENTEILKIILKDKDKIWSVYDGDTIINNLLRQLIEQGPENPEIYKILLENGADVNATNNDGNTLLHELAFAPDLEIINLLIENGADVNAINKRGESVFDFMIKKKVDNKIIEILKKHGAKSAK